MRVFVSFCILCLYLVSTVGQGSNTSRATTNAVHGAGRDEKIRTDEDALWVMTSAFIIFTMQSGFGLLESGSVSIKNEVNIMVKNAVDVIFGGLTFWMFGYGLSFGENKDYSNAFCGWGQFFVSASEEELGWVYSKFFFQASFATTATTIVSGSMAERTKLESYIVFSMINTFIFCFPAHWVWASNGWLRKLGVVDIAGAGPVHLVGGITGLVATILLKPRQKRFSTKYQPAMGSPTNAILGMFMLWWGWLGFNCGSTFGISGSKWKLAARSAVSTITASVSGGMVGLSLSFIFKSRRFDVSYLINGVLGSLVGITATCALAQPWEGLVIGFIGALITNVSCEVLNKLKIDDPVGCVGTHACAGIWSLLSAGLLTKMDSLAMEIQLGSTKGGLFYTGDFRQLGIQTLAAVVITVWTTVTSFVSLKLIDLTIGIRVPIEEELLGADIVEHAIGGYIYSKKEKKVIFYPDDCLNISDEGSNESTETNQQQRRHSLGLRLRNGSRSLIAKENRLAENKRKLIGCWKRRRKSATITTVQDLVSHVVKRNTISPSPDRKNSHTVQDGKVQNNRLNLDLGISNPNYVNTEEQDVKMNGNGQVHSDVLCKSVQSLNGDDSCRDNSSVTYL